MMTPFQNRRRAGSLQLVLDVGLVGALILTLFAVFGLDHLIGPVVPIPIVPPIEPVEEGASEPQQPVRTLRLGVTPERPEFDDMGKLLTTLGEGYKFRGFPLDDLLEDTKLAEFDIIFLTCSGYTPTWLGQAVGKGPRGGGLFTINPQVFAKAKECIRKFVGNGGTLYASDLHFDLISECFPEFVDQANVNTGEVQSVTAEVVDPGLREIIGSRVELPFDQPAWRPAAFHGEKCTSYMRGEFRSEDGRGHLASLLVKFPFEAGNVIFTSFHNEKVNGETATKLLRYLVFTAVTAGVESQVNKTMMRGGFTSAKQNLFSASSGAQSATQTYNCTKPADLQFVLGFVNQGARLKLSVTGPDGKLLEKEGTSTVTIDVPGAAIGAWKYTVTALHLPNENFPFTVTVGQK